MQLLSMRHSAAGLLLGLAISALVPAPAAAAALSTPEEVLGYLATHRDDISLVSYTVTPDGTPDPEDPVIRVNAFRPMPLASTLKIVLLAAYAREVAAGRLDPQEEVPLGEWDRYLFPIVDQGAHTASLTELGFATDELGFAVDPAATATLDQIAAAMIRHSDNAGTDLLLERIGEAAVRATMAEAGLARHDDLVPLTGLVLLTGNHEDGPLTPAHLRALLRQTPEQRTERIRELAALYVDDPAWKAAELAWWLEGTAPQPSPRLVARAANRLFTRGSANDYARIVAGVATGTFLSPEISNLMRRHLDWPMDEPQVADLFSSFGTKGGSIEGVLTMASWYVPRFGDFAGQPRVTVLFFRNLPIWAYEGIIESFARQDFQILLGVDQSFAELVEATLVH